MIARATELPLQLGMWLMNFLSKNHHTKHGFNTTKTEELESEMYFTQTHSLETQ